MPDALSSKKEQRGGPPDNLLAQWFILGAIIRDDRCRAIHAKVAWPILEAYFKKHGNGRASIRYLETATGLTKGSIATATADLVRLGYFTRVMGEGKRPTSYTPNWELASVLQRQDVLRPQDAISVLPPQDTSVLPPQDARKDSVPPSQDETPLRYPLTSGVTEGDSSPGAAGAGLAAAPRAVPFVGEGTIRAVDYHETDDSGFLEIEFEDADGDRWEHFITLDSPDVDERFAGQQEWQRLAASCGSEGESTDEVIGCRVKLGVSYRGLDRVPMATYAAI